MADYTLHSTAREVSGKKVKRLRAAGQVPAVLYGHNVAAVQLSVTRGELEKIYRQTGSSSVVELETPSGTVNMLIHDLQHDPRTGQYLHADFYQVRMDEKIKTAVPLEFEGTAPAVRELDGVLVTTLDELEIECLPGDLPQHITVNVESLATFEDSITVADLQIPAGVEVLSELDTSVANVQPPRTEAELEELDEEIEQTDAAAVEEVGDEAEGDESSEEDTDAKSE